MENDREHVEMRHIMCVDHFWRFVAIFDHFLQFLPIFVTKTKIEKNIKNGKQKYKRWPKSREKPQKSPQTGRNRQKMGESMRKNGKKVKIGQKMAEIIKNRRNSLKNG